jgi:hypothetical protein
MEDNIKNHILNLLTNQLKDFDILDGSQQRTIGDLIEHKIVEILSNTRDNFITDTIKARGKKSIEDITVISNGVNYYIDPKTHNVNAKFSMPNLTSIERLRILLSTPNYELIYIIVKYEIVGNKVIIKGFNLFYLWEIDCSILRVGALGKGQLQVKNAKKPLVFTKIGKENWFNEFRKLSLEFFETQIIKLKKQILDWE